MNDVATIKQLVPQSNTAELSCIHAELERSLVYPKPSLDLETSLKLEDLLFCMFLKIVL